MKEQLELNVDYPLLLPDVLDAIVAQTVEKFGTQLKAAWALGVTPQMISRRLNRHRKKTAQKTVSVQSGGSGNPSEQNPGTI